MGASGRRRQVLNENFPVQSAVLIPGKLAFCVDAKTMRFPLPPAAASAAKGNSMEKQPNLIFAKTICGYSLPQRPSGSLIDLQAEA